MLQKLIFGFLELSSVSTFQWHLQKIYSSWVLLYVVDMDFFGDIAFFGKFMVTPTQKERRGSPTSKRTMGVKHGSLK
jgi:hypothetical protein